MTVFSEGVLHHAACGRPQGRCTWLNLAVKPDEESNEEGEDDEKEGDPDEREPEVGPLLLTPLSQDGGMEHSTRQSIRGGQ